MNINKKKEMILIINRIVKNQRGSFTIEEIKQKIHKKLECRNFNNVSENIDEVNRFIKKMKNDQKLFKYNDSDERYFYVH